MNDFPLPTVHPSRASLPVLLSIPHSGRDYPQAILDRTTQGLACLEPLEDPLVDRLAWRAISGGVGAVIQNVPRAIIDCNRAEDETDPAAITGVSPEPVGIKAHYGLGIVPSRTRKHGKLWRSPIDRNEFHSRIQSVHRPYHAAIARELDRIAIAHGGAILIDLHSMPPRSSGASVIVIGNRHGKCASDWISQQATTFVRRQGFRVSLNDPYAGGEIVRRHGQPDHNIHALQIEIDRRLYLDLDLRSPGRGFDRVSLFVERLVRELTAAFADDDLSKAAE